MKIHETLPYVLEQMNKGTSFRTTQIAEMAEVTERTVLYRMNDIIEHVLGKRIYQRTHIWYGKPGFLDLLGLSAKEIVVMSGILSGRDRFGVDLSETVKKMMDALKRQGYLLYDEQQVLERTTSTMHVHFNKLRSAIDAGNVVIFEFQNAKRTVHPFRIINREYYWYLIGYEEYKQHLETDQYLPDSNKMKTYTIANIKRLETIDRISDYDFSFVDEILQHACNGFIDWEHPPHTIDVLVNSRLDNHLSRAAFYNNWKKIAPAEGRQGYSLYRVTSVHNQFRDVIPTILKHMPDMIVLYPLELIDAIRQRIEEYNMSMKPYLMSDLPIDESELLSADRP